jgi:hypothetical protein
MLPHVLMLLGFTGGGAVAVTEPDAGVMEWVIRDGRPHWKIDEGRPEYRVRDGKLEWDTD